MPGVNLIEIQRRYHCIFMDATSVHNTAGSQRDNVVLQRLLELVGGPAADQQHVSACLKSAPPVHPLPNPCHPILAHPTLLHAPASTEFLALESAGYSSWWDAWWRDHARPQLEARQRRSAQRQQCSRRLERDRPLEVEAVHEPSNITNRLSYHVDPEDRWRPSARRVC